MRTHRFAVAALALVTALAVGARADDGPAKEGGSASGPALKPGVEMTGSLTVDAADEKGAKRVAHFWFHVPEDAVMARIDVEGRADVNLYVARKPIEDLDAWLAKTAAAEEDALEAMKRAGRKKEPGQGEHEHRDALEEKRKAGEILLEKSETDTGTERVTLLREGDGLSAGDHFIAVAYEREEPPKSPAGKPVERIDFKVKLTLVLAHVDGKLEIGKVLSGVIEPKDGPFRTYTIEVPSTAKVLRFDLTDAPQDLNLLARKGKPILLEEEADEEAKSGIGTEELVIVPEDGEELTGTWYVEVVDAHLLDFATPFKLRASFSKEPESSLLALPKPPAAKSPLERATAGVVEILAVEGGGGSGVLISEKGYALTNYHVVQEEAEGKGSIGEPMIVALTLDPRDCAKESFRAKVVAVDPDLDLALVKCETGFYGQPIPADYKFPTVPLGSAEKLTIGDGLYAVGYPAVGGTGSRASITFTRGIVSGFERRGQTLHLKTDAMISPGNSGGGVLNEKFELVGFATETLSDEETNGVLGYVRPIWLVPQDWWAKAGVTPPKKAP